MKPKLILAITLTLACVIFSPILEKAVAQSAETETIICDVFDDMADGYTPSADDGWVLGGNFDTGSVTVQDDPTEPGNRALRMQKKDEVEWSTITARRLFDVESGIISISFRMRFESHTQYPEQAPTVYGYKRESQEEKKTGINAIQMITHNNTLNIKYDNNPNDVLAFLSDVTVDKNKWYQVEYIINLSEDSFDFYLDGVARLTNVNFATSTDTKLDIDGLESLYFHISTRASTLGRGESVYWYDDIIVRKYPVLDVTNTVPENNSTDITIEPSISIDFNLPLEAETVNKQNIKLFKNDEQVLAEKYDVSCNGSRILVTLHSKLENKTDYRVCISTDVWAPDALSGLMEEYNLKFKTIPPAFDVEEFLLKDSDDTPIDEVADATSEQILIQATIANNNLSPHQSYAITIALISPEDEMFSAIIKEGILGKGEKLNINENMTLPDGVGIGWRIECFVLKSFSNLKNLYDTVIR